MSIYTIYFSPTKGTEKIAETIAKGFGDFQRIDLSKKDTQINQSFNRDDICIIAVPSYGGRVPAIALDRMKNLTGNNTKTILVVAYGNRAYDDTLLELFDYTSAKGFKCMAGIAAIAQHSIMNQFATNRPDESDKQQLSDFSKQIIENIKSNKLTEVNLPGNTPYRDYNGVPLKPKASNKCNRCGKCAQVCPVGAIPLSDPKQTNKSLCITCMRCVNVCPVHARKVNALLVKIASSKLKASCENRKENELFI